MNDGEFERMLLQSARGDAPPGDARDAWARLAGSLSLVGGPSGAGLVTDDGRRGRGASTDLSFARRSLWPGSARTVAMKWLLVGALGGSAVTAAVMIRAGGGRTDAPAILVVEKAIAPAKVSGLASTPSPVIARDVEPGPVPVLTPPAATPATQARHAGQGRARALQEATGPSVSNSTLAAEVSRIDAARTANAGGQYDEALWLIERYQRDFPHGALAPDAEVVALEAVAAKRDRPETARRAALFLSRYPDDPHAARVRWLAEHRGTDQQ